MKQSGFLRFTAAVYFTYFESIKVYRNIHRACSLPEKALKHPCSAVTFVKA